MGDIVRVILPFKDQRSADFVWKQLKDLGNNISNPIQTVFPSPKIGEKLRIQDRKPPVVSRQCVVYQFKCALYDTDFIGYTTRHLRPRIEEHRATAVGAHVKGCHGISNPELLKLFSVLKEMPGKAWLPHQRNAFHPYEETEVEHTNELNSHESICLEHFNAQALICWLTI